MVIAVIIMLVIGMCLLAADGVFITKAVRACRAKEWEKLESICDTLRTLSVLAVAVVAAGIFCNELSKGTVSPILALLKTLYSVCVFAGVSAWMLYVFRRRAKEGQEQKDAEAREEETN